MSAADELCRRPPDDGAGGRARVPPVRGRLRAARRSAAVRSRQPGVSSSVTAVLLDMGGVVIPSLFESTAVPGFPAGPLGADAAWRSVEDGALPERDYWAALGRERPDVDLESLWRACSYVREEMRELITTLSARVKVAAFTNDMAHWFGEDWEERFSALTLFDAVIEASRLGVSKPDPEAFLMAAAVIDEPPERCLFVDDLEVNCAGARRVGMQTLLYDVRDQPASLLALAGRLGLGEDGRPGRVFRVG